MLSLVVLSAALLLWPATTLAFRCAGAGQTAFQVQASQARSKAARVASPEHRGAVVLFARFQDSPATDIPTWSTGLLDPDRPGSLSHFYDEMSFGRHLIRGQVVPQAFISRSTAIAYTSPDSSGAGGFSQFAREVVLAADAQVDFSRFDNDGPDGIPDSGDDDGVVDALFILIPQVPPGFIRGSATGIGRLEWDQAIVTDDIGASGTPIQISPSRGTIQQGNTFDEAVGSMAHEYGHVLGLPDLYNIDFLNDPEATPEDDSAGIGRWGLMGWGSRGWDGDSGPMPFSAWSRVRLGWADVHDVLSESEDLSIEDVARTGVVYRLPLTPREYYLLESRTPSAGTYDRDLPAEGLLIWHIERTVHSDSTTTQTLVDLVCADGLWRDAGPPLGRTPDLAGGDNLDFWSHDAAYREAHGGNLGDAGDVFSGGMSFTRDTNPAAVSADGRAFVAIEEIRRAATGMVATVHTTPLILALTGLSFGDQTRDGIFVAGEAITVHFGLRNEGGLVAQDVEVVVTSPDPAIQVVTDRARFGEIPVGTLDYLPEGNFPEFQFLPTFIGSHEATLRLDVYANGRLIDQQSAALTGLSPVVAVEDVGYQDVDGNPLATLAAGQVVRPVIRLSGHLPKMFDATVRYLSPRILAIGPSSLSAEGDILSGPQALLPLDPPDSLRIEVSTGSIFGTWRDTVSSALRQGPDRTPPLVRGVRVTQSNPSIEAVVAAGQFFDASPIVAVRARIESMSGDLLAAFPLTRSDSGYRGATTLDLEAGAVLRVALQDEAGNEAWSDTYALAASTEQVGATPWRSLPIDADGIETALMGFAFSRTDANLVIGVGQAGLFRSLDGGDSWTRLGVMFPTLPSAVLTSPRDPSTIFVGGRAGVWRSGDAGRSWMSLTPPGRILGISRHGTVFAGSEDGLFASPDDGQTWTRASSVLSQMYVPQMGFEGPIYSGHFSYYTGFSEETGTLLRSYDDGRSWAELPLPVVFESMVSVPGEAGLFAVRMGDLWASDDAGETWHVVGPLPPASDNLTRYGRAPWGLAVSSDGVLHAWSGRNYVLATSTDGGRSWLTRPIEESATARSPALYVNPTHPQQVFRTTNDYGRTVVMRRSLDYGVHWQAIEVGRTRRPSGLVAVGDDGQVIVGVGERDEDGIPRASIYRSPDGGHAWRRASSVGVPFGFSGLLPAFAEWQPAPTSPGRILSYIQSMTFTPLGNVSGYGVGLGLQRSNDGGSTWLELSGLYAFDSAPSLIPLRGADVVTSGVGTISVGYGGSAFSRLGEGVLRDEARVLAAAPNADGLGILLLVSGHPGSDIEPAVWSGSIVRDEWVQLAGLGEATVGQAVSHLARSPSHERLYAVTDRSLHLSDDEGMTWVHLSDFPLPSSEGSGRLRFHPSRADVLLLVAGHDLWLSEDAGRTWRSLADGPVSANWYADARFDPLDPSRLLVATPWGIFARRIQLYSATAVLARQPLPDVFSLEQVYPNPFNSSIAIRFSAPPHGDAGLTVYNVLGQRVRHLAANQGEPGSKVIVWDGRDDRGKALGSGVYFIRLRAGHLSDTVKVTMLR